LRPDHPEPGKIVIFSQNFSMGSTLQKKNILVTGGSGYLASWIVKQLLEEGYGVNTTVRNLEDRSKYKHLTELSEIHTGKLKIFEADLLKEGSFDEAVREVSVVIHTASPFKISGIRDSMKELVIPAVQGVQNVFYSAVKAGSVRRIVLTSSAAAIYGDAVDIANTESRVFTEKHWNTTSTALHQPYSYSKTLAEKEAWKIIAEHPEIELNVINPGFVLGPSLTLRKDSISISIIDQLISGKFRTGVPKGMHAVVDVRDVAKAHLLAAFSPVTGYRFIAAPNHTTFADMAAIVRQSFPHLPVPARSVPTWLFLLVGPFLGYPARFIRRNIGYEIWFDNTLIREKLGMTFRPLEETLVDQVEQLLNGRKLPI
jgi:nucleoside-diphosphate-sugar epimerase